MIISSRKTTHAGTSRRRGSSVHLVLGLLASAGAFSGVLGIYLRAGDDSLPAPPMAAVQRERYEHILFQQGEVESFRNVEIRCEIRANDTSSGASTTIIDVIPEGAHVEEGDWLVTFDSAPFEQELSRQRIAVNISEAAMIQSRAVDKTSVIGLDEYLEGTYNEQRKTIENEVFVAEENLKKAQQAYDSIDRLVFRNLLTPLQLEGEQIRVQTAQNELDLARQRLNVLNRYTKTRIVAQLENDILSAEVTYRNAKETHQEEVKILRDIEDQIAKCVVTAPQAGQVVYANVQSRRSGAEFVVEAGAQVRERQVILHLPDPSEMQVRTTLSESRIGLVREGMRVSIQLDAFRELELSGQIRKVNQYAEPGSYWSSSAKEYEALISIDDSPPQIRVGLTAQVQVFVNSRDNALTVPVQAVYERDRRTFCIVQDGTKFELREITIDSTDDKVVALDEENSRLAPGQQVVVHPRRHLHLIEASTSFPAGLGGHAATGS